MMPNRNRRDCARCHAPLGSVAGLVCALICLALPTRAANAAWHEGFESATPTWQPAGADVVNKVTSHQRVAGDAHSGQSAELLQINAAEGTHVYFSHDITPARIVAELSPTVWIKANRPGIQLLARVVLPHSADPRTGQPITALLRGSSYSTPGVWQQLRLVDTPRLLSQQVRVLRAQIGPQIEPREAYIDRVLLNVYGGSGQTVTMIDDLEIAGLVPRQPPAQPSAGGTPQLASTPNSTIDPAAFPANGNHSSGDSSSTKKVSLNGTILLVDGRPFFPRIIQSQGEPLAWLKELGFNAVRSNTPPTPQMLAEAQQTGLWLIAPPPEEGWQSPKSSDGSADASQPLPEIGPKYDSVMAWHLGNGLAARELPAISALSKQLRLADRRVGRPLVCDVEEELFNYSAHLPALSVHRFPLGSSLELLDYGSWLRERPRLARPGKPFWTTIQTEPAAALVTQAAALAGSNAAEPTVDAGSLRLLVYQAFCSGVRGMEFASSSRLDAGDNATRIRALSLALLNLELELLEPWGAASKSVTAATSSDPNVRGVVIGADAARLVVVMRCPKGSQYVAAPPPVQGGGASIVVPGVPESHNVYELTLAGLRPLRSKRIAGGTAIAIEDFPLTALALITPDPLVVNTMKRRLETMRLRAARLERDLAATVLAETEAVQRRFADATDQTQLPSSDASVAGAKSALQRADQLFAAGDVKGAYFAARNAMLPVSRWKREVWNRTAKSLGSPTASPLAVSFNTLPDHLNFARAVAGVPPGENLLPGGDFEDLQAMLQAGWRHFQHPQPQVQTTVELSPLAPYADRFSLRLQALPENADTPPALVESPPLWVTSAPVRVEAGDVVCIRGQVRVSGPISGSVDGLMIVDSLGGEALAERFDETNSWREFVMYRAAPHSGPLTVTFALSGVGEAWIDDVSIRRLRSGIHPHSTALQRPWTMAPNPLMP